MIDRIYYHYEDLEEYHDGMWRIAKGDLRKAMIDKASKLMKNPDMFYAKMLEALELWPKSCDHNLTANGVNHIAWLGHAGCCIGVESTEETTRCAWHTLDKAEQDEANRVAGDVLEIWRDRKITETRGESLFDFNPEC